MPHGGGTVTRLTKPMLRLLLDLHDAPGGRLLSASVPLGTARALVHRSFARWSTDKAISSWPTSLVIEPKGRRVVSNALVVGTTNARGWAA